LVKAVPHARTRFLIKTPHARSVRLAYQPPASSTFLSEQTSHQQPASSTFLSAQTSTGHQPPAKRTGWMYAPHGQSAIMKNACDRDIQGAIGWLHHFSQPGFYHTGSRDTGCVLGVRKNRRDSPNTEVQSTNHTSYESCKKETRNLRKYALTSKVVNPFTSALAPPFIGRRRGFLY
jgi:hypothetical protein